MSFTVRQLRDYINSHMDFDLVVYDDPTLDIDSDSEIFIQDIFEEVNSYYEDEG